RVPLGREPLGRVPLGWGWVGWSAPWDASRLVLQRLHQFVDDHLGVAALRRRDHVIPDVCLEDVVADLAQRALDGADLLEHVDAVHVRVLEHPQYALDVSAHALQAPRRVVARGRVQMQAGVVRAAGRDGNRVGYTGHHRTDSPTAGVAHDAGAVAR